MGGGRDASHAARAAASSCLRATLVSQEGEGGKKSVCAAASAAAEGGEVLVTGFESERRTSCGHAAVCGTLPQQRACREAKRAA